MIYNEVTGDLFEKGKGRILCHCISADFALGAGIAVKFANMGVKSALKNANPDAEEKWEKGICIVTFVDDNVVCNLVTKRKCWQKPTYENLQFALGDMKTFIKGEATKGTVKIGMPLIGCGLDGLNWSKVSRMIQDTFSDLDVDILVVKYQK